LFVHDDVDDIMTIVTPRLFDVVRTSTYPAHLRHLY
jgi:hypothetical protein